MAKINQAVTRSKELVAPPPKVSTKSINSDLQRISQNVVDYFKDSNSILITSEAELSDYIDKCIEAGYAGIDTETTGLDRIKDTIVGSSLYYPGGVECYIPNKHIVPIFEEPYKNQLTYEQCQRQFQRLVAAKVKMIFANADFDLAMLYKDYKVDFIDTCYYDVILAWRCLKENELHNDLKSLYNKYVLKGKGDPKRFSDFFPVKLFPYCKPEVAKLYAANDAKITFELFKWQLPYATKDHPKCKKAHLEKIADLIWNVEFPLIKVCQNLFRTGMYIDKDVAEKLRVRYNEERDREMTKLRGMVQEVIDNSDVPIGKAPFHSGADFNPSSPPHVKHLLYTLLKIPQGKGTGTGKEVLHDINLPITNQILKVRSLGVLINTFVDKLPNSVAPDGRIHAQFRSVGAATGRFSSAEPNLQNIPSHAVDIRHMFRATPGYMLIGSDYSAQEPRMTSFVSQDPKMIQSFKDGKDIYGTIASVAFNLPYEKCLEFHPETHEYQPDGKARRSEAKVIVLGITYGRSVPSIAEQMYGTNDSMTDDEKIKKAQHIYDSVLNAFPNLRKAMIDAQTQAKVHGYTETILGRRRHLPDMQLPEFEFKAMPGYVNPDIDPMDMSTLNKSADIPVRIVKQLEKEFKSYKYFGQIAKRTKELAEEHIRVINNRPKINDASRQCLNCVDSETEILTTSGWKHYDEICVGDSILSFNMDKQCITQDSISDIHVYNQDTEVVEFKSPTFHAVSTPGHRWVCQSSRDSHPRFITTDHIERNQWPDYPILRVSDNDLRSTCSWSDDQIRLLGWILTDGSINTSSNWYGLHICQSTNKPKNRGIYEDMIDTLNRLGYQYNDQTSDGVYHSIYVNKNDWTYAIFQKYRGNRCLDFEFINSLNQHQATLLMWTMIECDGTLGEDGGNITYTCSSKEKCDAFQYLAFVAGYASSYYITTPEEANRCACAHKVYDSLSNQAPIIVRSSYYTVNVFRIKRAQIYPHHKSRKIVPMVWCVTTKNGTWVARRSGKVYITGNSIIQGSAADQTKLAILMIENNEEWKRLGARLLVPVHDELIAEAPIENAEEAGKLLSKLMCDAANFLPFDSKCDIEQTYRWYGMEAPCPYSEPLYYNLDEMSDDEIKWIQYHIVECEYILPVFKDENGDKPRGDAAKGVNGKVTDELKSAVSDYCHRYSITTDEFISHIKKKVQEGTV